MTRSLSIEEYGTWSLIISSVGLILPFSGMGLSSALSRFGPGSDDEELRNAFSTLFTIKFTIHSLIALLLFFFCEYVGNTLFQGQDDIPIYVGAILLIASLEPLYKRILKIKGKIIYFSTYEIWSSYSLIFLAVFFASENHLLIFLQAYIAWKALNLVVLTLMIGNVFKVFTIDNSILLKYRTYGGYAALTSITFWIINSSDRFILSNIGTLKDVGVYNSIYSIGLLPRTISSFITFLLLISLAKLYETKKLNEVKLILFKAENLFISIVLPLTVGSLFFSEEVLLLLSTSEISRFGSPNLFIITLAHLFLGIVTFRSYPFLLKKRQKFIVLSWFFAMVINLALNVFLIPYLGILGSSIATFTSYFFLFILVFHYSRSQINYGFSLNLVLFLFISALISNFIGLIILRFLEISILWVIAIVVLLYFLFVFFSLKKLLLQTIIHEN